jgi:type II secretory pathway pseudopilin PulG
MVALSILAIGALTVLGTMVYSLRLDTTNRETTVASQAARRVLEEIRSEELDDVVALYNSDETDDPDGAGTAPGDTFSVTLLEDVIAGMANAGSVVLPINDAGEVREDLDIPELGMPRDLNGDGAIDDLDHSGDLMVLPVMVRVSWDGVNGDRQIDFRTVLR